MIAVISDSHIPSRAEEIPEKFLEKVEKAEITVHCGDFVTEELHDCIEAKAEKFVAVKGNCERFELPSSETFSYEGHNFGAYHGTGINPRGHHPTLLRIVDDLDVDVLFHGHTHQQEAVKKEGKLLLNPGSCTGVGGGSSERGNPKMITVDDDQGSLIVKLVELTDGCETVEERSFNI